MARSPVPVATSSAREPGPTRARSAARRRQRWCIPAVMTEFIRSYTRAMRSNIARTCVSGRVPEAGAPPLVTLCASSGLGPLRSAALFLALERRDVLDELVELLGLVFPERPV